jgi:hypothetical protein
MDNLNKTVSFVLGLVVVLVFLAIITGRFNLKNKLPFFSGKVSPTPTVSATPTPKGLTAGTKAGGDSTYGDYKIKRVPSSIPATGSPTILLPLLFSGLGGGFFFKKLGKK